MFKTLVHYQKKAIIVHVKELKNYSEWKCRAQFPDGTRKLFYIADEDNSWTEKNAGKTDLARAVGSAVNDYFTYKTEPYSVEAFGINYTVLQIPGGKTPLYNIYTDDLLGTLFVNETGQWLANTTLGDKMITAIGEKITDKNLQLAQSLLAASPLAVETYSTNAVKMKTGSLIIFAFKAAAVLKSISFSKFTVKPFTRKKDLSPVNYTVVISE